MNRSFFAWALMSLLSLSLMYAGKQIADRQGLLLAFIISLILNAIVYFYGDIRIKKLFQSKQIEGRDPFKLESICTKLCAKLHMKLPQIYICKLATPTAFSTGHNASSASIVLSLSLLQKLDEEELEAVLSYELNKIKSSMTFSATICSAIAAGTIGFAEKLDYLISFGKSYKEELGPITGLVSPLITWFLRRVQPKKSIFELDRISTQLTGNPRALAQSLWKLESLVATQPELVPKDTAHIFFINPLPKYGWAKMFQTQPSAKERIEKLIGQYPI